MANPKRHWAIPTNNPRKHRHPWMGHAGGYYAKACGRKYCSDTQSGSASAFLSHVEADPDWHCADCAKAARLALAKESAPTPTPRPARSCSNCRSGAINPGHHGRDESTDLDLCDVCYWRKRAPEPRPIGDAPTDGTFVLAHWSVHEYPRLRGLRWAIVRTGTGLVWCTESGEPLSKPTHFLPLPPSPEVK